jgi:hypothetical protein
MTANITLTYTPDSDYARERLGPVTLTVPHGDIWCYLVDDFVAFLRLTGYHIDDPWVEQYSHHKMLGEKAAQLLEKLEYDEETGTVNWERLRRDDGEGASSSEDEMEPTPKRRRNSPAAGRNKSVKRTKKKAKK